MKKNKLFVFISTLFFSLFFLSTPFLVSAQETQTASEPLSSGDGKAYLQGSVDSELPGAPIYDIVSTAMMWMLAILGFIAIIGFAISGILYLTAAGNDTLIKQAKNAMWYSILGVIVALMGAVVVFAVDAWLNAGDVTGI